MIQPLLTARKAGAKLGTSEAFCKKCYEELGGFLIGGKLRFTEESIENAIQNKIRAMDGAGPGKSKDDPAPMHDKERGRSLGGGKAARIGEVGGGGMMSKKKRKSSQESTQRELKPFL